MMRANASEYHFMMVFGSQSHPKQLRYTHTWATFVRAVGEGPDLASYQLEVFTISWLPRTLNVRVLALRPEPGINLDLYTTLNAMLADREHITMWGPFVASPRIYNRAVQQFARLQSGAIVYRAIDSVRDPSISDCIHAVADIDPDFGRSHYPLVRIGSPASRYIVRQIMSRSPIDQSAYNNEWLIYRLGLNQYPIKFVSPRESPYLHFPPLDVPPR
jgi:hypothetical protein